MSGGTLCRYADRSIETSSFTHDPPRTIRSAPEQAWVYDSFQSTVIRVDPATLEPDEALPVPNGLAALAMITERLQLRSGSLISPLHDAIRIAEEWSLVDQLSAGRVAISFGSGWNVNDFVFFPERYDTRRQIMYEQIDTIRALWRGKPLTRKNSFGKDVELTLYPKPVQPELPIWITSSGHVDTFRSAGAWDANVLTHMITQDIYTLKDKISV